ncbi:MAG: Pyruvate/2-oxoacid:ferredoxin oxidoreductase delta subunit [Gammaproteobacteria bacterium]|jgi:Pyruvate/2-oxoacid:ferredoxin oxidoreductase delta subunit
MSWILPMGLVSVLGLSLFAIAQRRSEMLRMHDAIRARDRAVRIGSDKAQLQHPIVDMSRCLGCATCVAACPEDGVLEMLHGQAIVVRGARSMELPPAKENAPWGRSP